MGTTQRRTLQDKFEDLKISIESLEDAIIQTPGEGELPITLENGLFRLISIVHGIINTLEDMAVTPHFVEPYDII
jgi:hypothetical protein